MTVTAPDQEGAPPDYWLGVCEGRDAASAFALVPASDTERLVRTLYRYPILVVRDFPFALHRLATEQSDPRRRMVFMAAARELETLHAALSSSAAAMWGRLNLGCGLLLKEEQGGNRVANLHQAIRCFTAGAAVLEDGPDLAECRLSEAMAIQGLVEIGAAGGPQLERALELVRTASGLYTDGRDVDRCLLNEGNIRERLGALGVDSERNLARAIELFRQARERLDPGDLYTACLMNEANARQTLAECGIEPQQNLEQAIELYHQAEAGTTGSEDRAWLAMNEGAAWSRLAVLGVDTAADLKTAVRLFAEARALFGRGPGVAMSLLNEGSVRAQCADLGIDSRDNAQEAVNLFRAARSIFGQGAPLANCLEREANARETLGALGVDSRANFEEAVRLWKLAAGIHGGGERYALCLNGEAMVRQKLADLGTEERDNREAAVRLTEQARAICAEGPGAAAILANHANALRDLAGLSTTAHTPLKQSLLQRAIDVYRQARALAQDAGITASTLVNEANACWRLGVLGIDASENFAEAARLAAELRRGVTTGPRFARALALEGTARRNLAERGVEPAVNAREAERLLGDAAVAFRALGFHSSVMTVEWELGSLLHHAGRDEEAHDHLAAAIEALEDVRASITLLEDRRAWMERTSEIFRSIVEICLRLDRFDEGLEYAERGRSRALVDLLSLEEFAPRSVAPEVAEAYQRLRRHAEEIQSLLSRAEEERDARGPGAAGGEFRPRSVRLPALLRERATVFAELERLTDEIRHHDPDFLAVARPLTTADLTELARRLRRPLLTPWIGREQSTIFVVLPTGERTHLTVPGMNHAVLQQWLFGGDEARAAGGWIGSHAYDPTKWRQRLDDALRSFHDRLMAPIHRWALDNGVQQVALIVGGALGSLPLHAAAVSDSGRMRYVLDDLDVLYAPSAWILNRCVTREGGSFLPFLAVANPSTVSQRRLQAAEWETGQIARLIARRHGPDSVERLVGAAATAARVDALLPTHPIAHFSCHGIWDASHPLDSALLLAGEERLTLGHLIGQVNMRRARMAVLSACDTARGSDPSSNADEYLGLPAGFIVAGSQAVIGSLWPVEDEATALLMTRLYQHLLDGLDTSAALRRAQLWLRELRADEAERMLGWRYAGAFEKRGDRPFAHPACWAAFVALGAPISLG